MLRKIESEEERELRQKKRTRILTVLMLILLLGSTAGYAFLSSNNDSSGSKKDSSGVQNLGDRWGVNIGNQTLYFASSPEFVKNTSLNFTSDLSTFYGKPLYINGENDTLNYEIGSTIGQYASRVQRACYGNCTEDFPEKTCTDNLIVINSSAQNRVYQKDNCIFIDGNLQAVDAFLYRAFGLY